MKPRNQFFNLIITVSFFLLPAISKSENTLFDLMQNNQPLEVTLEMDLEALLANRRNNDYLPAAFKFKDQNGKDRIWNIDVRMRGRFRRMKCEFPPLKLKFNKGQLAANGLASFNKFKLVTHCNNIAESTGNILKEQLAYDIYQTLTPYSFRTQLVKVTYIDSKTGDSFEQYGIIIEPTKQLEDRLNAERCEDCYNVSTQQILDGQESLQALFQYMIGNTDWSTKKLRNLKMLKIEKDQKMIPVPYDFDFSGLVSTNYAVPATHLGLTEIKERLYLGDTAQTEDIQQAVTYFISLEQVILDQAESLNQYDQRAAKESSKYLKDFFKTIQKDTDFYKTDLLAKS